MKSMIGKNVTTLRTASSLTWSSWPCGMGSQRPCGSWRWHNNALPTPPMTPPRQLARSSHCPRETPARLPPTPTYWPPALETLMYCSPAPAPPWPWLRGGYVVNDNKDVQAFGRIKPSYLGFVFSLSCFVLLLCFFIGSM
jgi:hypothetical protein